LHVHAAAAQTAPGGAAEVAGKHEDEVAAAKQNAGSAIIQLV
jgi:hypothetical protein